MASAITKRQQARNERQLQELIHGVPGNDRCADCAVKNPGWASWSLGIFLCVRCASLHRKLGTHVSKVKSLSMDSWSAEQVDNMRKTGNVKSNAVYNPRNVRPDIPIDADEIDGAMERFIRQKYESRTLSATASSPAPAARQTTGSTGTGSWNEEPPPLPPKPKKFGFNLRSSSSVFSRPKQDRITPPISPAYSGSDRSGVEPTSPHKNKPSQVFGMKITTVNNNFDGKLAALRDMGFSDNRRNSEILKSTNGDVVKAVETLVRLGEGNKSASKASTLDPRALTPVSMAGSAGNGISVEKRPEKPDVYKKLPDNPWEIKEEPQRAVSQPLPQPSIPPRSQSADPTSTSWNPFSATSQPSQAQQSLVGGFQSLQVSQTGPGSQRQYTQQPIVPQIPQQYQNNPFMSQQRPAMPQSNIINTFTQPQPYQPQPTGPVQADQYSNPFLQSRSDTSSPSNPWLSQAAQPNQQPIYAQPLNPWASQTQQTSPWASQAQSPAPAAQQASNPFGQPAAAPWPQQQQSVFQQPATASPSPMYGQQEYFTQQQQQPIHQAPAQQSSQQVSAQNPWQQQQQPQMMPAPQTDVPQQQQFQQNTAFTQPTVPSQPIRHDKSSILALYNMPHLAPRQPLQTLQEDPYAAPSQQYQQQMPTQRSVTMPLQQSGTPFMSAPPQTQMTQGIRHVSNESVDFVGMGVGASGRHSPDAFSGLSAQYMR